MDSILSLFENTAARFPDNTAVAGEGGEYSYRDLSEEAKRIGNAICSRGYFRSAAAVFLPKSFACIASMLGVLYSGNYYTVLDTESPSSRISSILEILDPAVIITSKQYLEILPETTAEILLTDTITKGTADEALLASVRRSVTDADLMYALFTSGSTGKPKGALLTHRAVYSYMNWVRETFSFNEETVFGSQTPLYFSMSVTDLFGALTAGGTYVILDKKAFSFPLMLLEQLNKFRVNTLYWVPSALGILCGWDALSYAKPEYVTRIFFAGESMPVKYLNYWRKHLPDAEYYNLFGPTETTDICLWYKVDRDFAEEEAIPAGIPCKNCDSFALTEDGRRAETGERGELYVRGSFLASGYLKEPEKTAAAFVQNPLHQDYPETVYRTGDLMQVGEDGNLYYLGRKDSQIKHMGYRIEPGEIERAAMSLDGINMCAVIYDNIRDTIILIYQGEAGEKEADTGIRALVPEYMVPGRYEKLSALPLNANGKTDRKALKKLFIK